ncbi:MAG: RNA polymerase sigma factor [Tepidisphaeraceae bacterium]
MECVDSELVAQSLAGRRDAFRQIVERYQTLICSLAYSATGSLGRSEDLAQETFVTAWKELAQLREPSKLRPWLCTIVRFLIGKELRRQGREPTESAEPLDAVGEVAAPGPLPPEQAISEEEKAILWRSLENIPKIYREPLVLFYREHQSVEKVAAELELTEDAVRQRLSRGRNLLREQMLAFVEGALAKTSPGKAFAVAVVAALPLLATSAKAVTVGAAIKGASSGKAATGLKALVEAILMTSSTKLIISAAIVVALLAGATVGVFSVIQDQTAVVIQNPTPVVAQNSQAPASRSVSIHIRGQLRAPQDDNFVEFSPDDDFITVELWKQFEPTLKWRAERPGRVAVMDGQSTLLYLKKDKVAWKLQQASPSAFDTDWIQRIANVSNSITSDIRAARAKGWRADVAQETAKDGHAESVVTIESKAGLPDNNYLKNSSFDTADLRRVYRFDAQTKQLEAVQIYVEAKSGEVLIFQSSQIESNQPIDSAVFHLDLPADVSWPKEPQKLPDNAKYAAMTAEQAARDFFEACGRQDWNEVQKFDSLPLNDSSKEFLGGLEIVSLGNAFSAEPYPGRFVPYEIKLPPQKINLRLSNANSAKRYVITGICDGNLQLQEELKWPNEPEILSNNDVYAKMSPVEVVQACCQAVLKSDWAELRKFIPEDAVEKARAQFEDAKKQGLDVRNFLPVIKEGAAFWSAEQSAYFVKCSQPQANKKWNLALRKDNPAGRWQVDGGL